MTNKEKAIPLKSYLYYGIPVALGVDPSAFPLYEPQVALWQALNRTTKGGYRLDAAESISIQEALRMQTMGSAYAGFQEKEFGSLEPGKFADLVVWNRDYYRIPPNETKDVKAMLTLMGEKIVHENKGI